MSDSNIKKNLAQGGALGIGVVLVVAILAAVNYLSYRHHERFDWTTAKLYSLSEKTTNVLASVDQDLEIITVMDPQDEVFDALRELLARYAAANPRITVRELDSFRNPVEAKLLVERFGLQRADVVVVARADGSDKRLVETADLAEYDYSGAQFGEAPRMKAFNGEREITQAIVELISAEKPKVLVTTGHGEAGLDERGDAGLSEIARLLGGDNLDIEEWTSLGAADVPADAALVIVPGPKVGFAAPELEAFDRYLERGGRMVWLLDPALDAATQLADETLRSWLLGHGIEVGNDLVLDPNNPLPFFGPQTIFASSWGDHPAVASFEAARASVLLPVARSVVPAAGGNGTILMRTSAAGWGERDLAALPSVGLDPTDLQGPVGLAVAAEVGTDQAPAVPPASEGEPTAAASPEAAPKGRLLVVGDSDFVTNGYLANANNGSLFANVLNWMLERENQLGIETKTPEQVRLTMTAAQMSTARWMVLAGMPLAAIAAGILVQRRRRRR